MIAVVETDRFLEKAKYVLSSDERDALILYLAYRPDAGDVIPDTGGIRKLRWAAKGKGKRGGSRVIYYYHNLKVPLFLLSIFAKSVQGDLAPLERKSLIAEVAGLKADWKKRIRK